jgi:hypothetical protein
MSSNLQAMHAMNERHDIQHNDTQHNDIQHNDIQHNEIQYNDTQHKGLIFETQHKRQSAVSYKRNLLMKYTTLSLAFGYSY